MADFLSAFFTYWDCGDLEAQPGTKKIFYRKIGARKYQFRKVDYKARTALFFEALTLGRDIGSLFELLKTVPEDADDDQLLVAVLPAIIEMLTAPGVQTVLQNLCNTVAVDMGRGSFESLTEEHVAEEVFGADLTLQAPVAATAALINFDTLLSLVNTTK